MASYIYHNNFKTTLTATLLIGGTSATVDDATPLVTPPAGKTLHLTLISASDSSVVEIIAVTAVTGNVFTITKAREGSVAREWPIGTKVEARVTAAMLTDMAAVDSAGNARGTNALDLQSGRDGVAEVASGSHAVAQGYGNTASGISAIARGKKSTASGNYSLADGDTARALSANSEAVGQNAACYQRSDLTLWAATTVVATGAIRRIAGSASVVLYCRTGGTTGAAEPSGVSGGGYVTDGTVVWYSVYPSATSINAIARGAGAVAIGASAVAIGKDAVAIGDGAVAIGAGAVAVGANAFVRGSGQTSIGEDSVGIGRAPFPVAGRTAPRCVSVGRYASYAAFRNAAKYGGYPFVEQHDWLYEGVASLSETEYQSTREVTLYSIPVQLGNAAWPGATQTVKHGHSIRVGAYIYTAYIYSGYFTSGTTGGTEPVWPTTPGDSVGDGDFDWLCVGASIEWLMPDYARFVPVSVGAIARSSVPGGGVTYPQITAGINGDLDKWLAATTLSKLTGNYSQHLVDPTNTEGAKQFGIELTTAGGDLNCVAVLVVKGYVVESEVA